MSKTNTLNSHHGERRSHRADKMSGSGKEWLRLIRDEKGGNKFMKKFTNKKRRALLNNEKFYDKI